MKGSNDFPVKKEKSILLLIAGLSLDAVAKKLKISPVTLWRWQQEDLYVARYRHLRRVRVEHSIAALQSLTNDAVECLRRNLTSGNRPSEVRSALGILTKSLEGLDIMEIETRVSEVEARLEIKK
jgi:AraC-like DNA-binding protein